MIDTEAIRKPGNGITTASHALDRALQTSDARFADIKAEAEVEAVRLAVSLLLAVIDTGNAELAARLRTYRQALDAALASSTAPLVAATRVSLDAIFSDAISLAATGSHQ